MRRRAFQRRFTKLAQSYRWERNEALARAARAEAKLDAVMGALAKAEALRGPMGQELRIVIDASDLIVHYTPVGDELDRLAQRIALGLAGLQRDYRGDLRQTPAQRAFGVTP